MALDEPKVADLSNAESLAARIQEHRRASRLFFEERRTRWQDLQERLVGELEAVVSKLDVWEETHNDIESRHLDLRKERQGLDRQRVDLEERSCELDQQKIAIENKRRLASRELEARRADLKATVDENDSELKQNVESLQNQLHELQKTADGHEKSKRKLKGSLEKHSASRNRLESEYRSTRDALVASRHDEKQMRQQVAKSKKLLNERAQQVSSLREQLEQSLSKAKSGDGSGDGLGEELIAVQRQRDELQEQITEMEFALQNRPESSNVDDYEDLRRQFEMAVESVRALKEQNESLESELATSTGDTDISDKFDWEAQKAQMLGQLEGDATMPPLNRLTVQKTIDVTDRLVKEKDQEIALLHGQLEQLHGDEELDLPDEAVDSDARIKEERERLKRLQEEWREKLRAAEVEIAVERAGNARSRANLEEKTRELENQARVLANLEKEKGPGRRWMDHLGLGPDDE